MPIFLRTDSRPYPPLLTQYGRQASMIQQMAAIVFLTCIPCTYKASNQTKYTPKCIFNLIGHLEHQKRLQVFRRSIFYNITTTDLKRSANSSKNFRMYSNLIYLTFDVFFFYNLEIPFKNTFLGVLFNDFASYMCRIRITF